VLNCIFSDFCRTAHLFHCQHISCLTECPYEYTLQQRVLRFQQVLHKEALYESNEEATQREEVLGQLDGILKAWVKAIAQKKTMSEATIAEANATMFTFGSYRLGVHGPGMIKRARATRCRPSCCVPDGQVPIWICCASLHGMYQGRMISLEVRIGAFSTYCRCDVSASGYLNAVLPFH
jgi:hypothetical protein